MTTLNLDLLFERTLRALMLCSDGRTTSFEGKVVGGDPDYTPKASERDEKGRTEYTMDDLLRTYEKAESSGQRREVISRALEAVRQARYAPDRSKQRGTKEWREAIGADHRGATVVAAIFDVDRKTVYNFRRQSAQMKRAA